MVSVRTTFIRLDRINYFQNRHLRSEPNKYFAELKRGLIFLYSQSLII